MTQEEKARRYNEVKNKLSRFIAQGVDPLITRADVQDFFPELAESEDEKIRKTLIQLFQSDNEESFGEFTNKQFVAWLEKQGEHANFRNKIQVGDKVTRNEAGVLVNLSQLKRVAKPSENQGKQSVGYTTIVETGDGGINSLVIRDIEIPFGAKDSELQEFTYFIPKGYYAKIEDDKVVIKKGEQEPEENKGNLGGISPNWSEEDGMMLSLIVNNLKFICDTISHDNKYTVDVGSFEGQIEWLKSLQDRVQPQPKQEWSKEEEAVLDALIRRLEGEDIYVSPYLAVECLKSLKDRVGCEANCTTTKEWNEEDEHRIKDTVYFLDTAKIHYASTEELDACIDWLQSLKGRVRPHWKPSDEQMKLLSEVQSALLGKDCHNRFTCFMWELKKLKEG